MGKTENGAVWLDEAKTSPYDFFQYWRNVSDADVIKCLKMLTFVPIEEIEKMEKTMEGAEFNKAKELLAYELTKLVHGDEEAQKAREAAKAVFGGAGHSDNMPTVEVSENMSIVDLLVATGLAPSKSEARRLVQGGGVSVDDRKIQDFSEIIEISDFVILKKGKKSFTKVIKK